MLAVIFVASPFYIRSAISAFEAVDPDAAAGRADARREPGRAFFRVSLPLAAGGLGSGAALSFARGIGEFGATIMFAGSFAVSPRRSRSRSTRRSTSTSDSRSRSAPSWSPSAPQSFWP